jgi:hypothetical protein
MKPDDRDELYEEWEDDSERVEKVRKMSRSRGGDSVIPRAAVSERIRKPRRPGRQDKF